MTKKRKLITWAMILASAFNQISQAVKTASADLPPVARKRIERNVNETNYYLGKTVKDLSKIKLKTVREAEDMFRKVKDDVNALANLLRDDAKEMQKRGLVDKADKLLEVARQVDIFFSKIVGFTSILEDIEKFEIELKTVRRYGRKIKKHHKSIKKYVKSMTAVVDELGRLRLRGIDTEAFRRIIHDLAMESIRARLSNIATQIGEIIDPGEYSSDLGINEMEELIDFAKELSEDGIFTKHEYYSVIDWCNKYLKVGPYKE